MLSKFDTTLEDVDSCKVRGSAPSEHSLMVPSAMTTTKASYESYFSSGIYKQRYPNVNQQTLANIHYYCRSQPENFTLLDYGCGDGRYLLRLLESFPCAQFVGYDISLSPIETLREALKKNFRNSQVKTIYDENAQPHNFIGKSPKYFNVVLLLFGVLSHVSSSVQRQQLLTYLRDRINPKSGYLLISVPNQKRRFLKLQKQQRTQDIIYSRSFNKKDVPFYYHLYNQKGLYAELSSAGFQVIRCKAESVFPESWVTRHPLLGWLDRQLCRVVPAQWGYGILCCCRPIHKA